MRQMKYGNQMDMYIDTSVNTVYQKCNQQNSTALFPFSYNKNKFGNEQNIILSCP